MKKHFIKKTASIFLLFILIVLTAAQFCGCGPSRADSPGSDGPSGTAASSPSVADASGSGSSVEGGLFLSEDAGAWRDNSLDAYSAVINAPIRCEEPEHSTGGISCYSLNETKASAFRLHFIEEDGITTQELLASVTDRWEESSTLLSDIKGTVRGFGSNPGNNRCLILCAELPADYVPGNEVKEVYSIYELDEALNQTLLFRTPYLDTENIERVHSGEQLLADRAGRVHIVTSQLTHHYYITDPDGTVLYHAEMEHEPTPPKLVSLYDGRVAMLSSSGLQCFDPETERLDILAKSDSSWLSCSLLDEKTLLYVTGKGLYTSSLSGKDASLLYKWSDHGILPSDIRALQPKSDGSIRLIYTDSSGGNYLRLEPTAEEREVKEIVLATMKFFTDNYLPAVVEFNKKYPAYHIRIEEYDWQDTALLTKLIAGQGPVLIDSVLTGFENHADYWEPLDEVLGQLSLEDKLLPKALELGRIDGTLYGIPQDFYIETVVTAFQDLSSWTYEDFLNRIDADTDLESYFNYESGDSGVLFALKFFMREWEDNYLMDAKNRTTRFDSEEFRRILRLGKVSEGKHGGYEQMQSGKMLCDIVNINHPEDISLLRILFPEGLNYIGFPAQDSSAHYIVANNILAVRAGATEEEKRIAHSFLRILLSYDCQKTASEALNYNLSIRGDVLDAQIAAVARGWMPYIMNFPQVVFEEDQLDPENDGKLLYELIEKAQPKKGLPRELQLILLDELDEYYSGNITEDMLIRNLSSRAGLYLKEQQ